MCINMSKVCIKCKQTKSTTEFSKNKLYKDGLQNQCKQCKNIQRKIWDENNPNYFTQYRKNNKTKLNQQSKDWNEKNKKHKQQYQSRYVKQLLQDPTEKLKHYLRVYVGQAVKEIGTTKNQSTLNIVGLESWDKLREHIEKQWIEGMNWSNHGAGKDNTTWHIDHIIPLDSATTEDEVYKLNHYTNLRPMWGSDNIKKKNKIF